MRAVDESKLTVQAHAASTFAGYDGHRPSIKAARKLAADAGPASRARFEVAAAEEFPGQDLDLITCLASTLNPSLRAAKAEPQWTYVIGNKTMTTQDPLDLRVPYQIIATDLPGVFISPPPPADFDPNTASRQSLIRNGFLWRRPDAGDDPALRSAWDRVFSRRWRAEDRLVPEFEPQIGKTHSLRNLRRAEDGSYTGDNWAGSIVEGDWVSAVAYWQVPTVTRPPSGSGWSSASWVGLDGFRTHDVLQAGVGQDVGEDGSPSYYAWFEWSVPDYPGAPPYIYEVKLPNSPNSPGYFPVTAGETILCSVVYVENHRAGQIYLANEDSGAWFSITLAPPQGAALSGRTAEWIMEAPTEPPALPVFSNVEFTTAFCCSNMLTTVSNPGEAGTFTVNIADAAGTITSVKPGWGTTTIRYAGPA